MALLPEKLRILTFPQRISGDQLELNVLLLPTQRLLNLQTAFPSQLNGGGSIDLPRFINADLELEVTTLRGLSSYPFSNPGILASEGVTANTQTTTLSFPANLPLIYEGLAGQFKLTNTTPAGKATVGAEAPLADSDGIRKYLPVSYRTAFNFTNPRTEFAKTDDSYHCAFKNTTFNPAFTQGPDAISWGRVIAFCLRQPLLAKSIGLLHQWTLTLPDADYFADGGWVYFHLTSPPNQFDITNPAIELREYAARIPDIDEPRQLFAALLFPVVPGPAPPVGEFDLLKIEAADYDDGFAKIVHAFQPVSANILSEEPDGIHVQKDSGIRLGWDDEQLLIWQNRQVLADPNTLGAARIDAPLGVFSYRVDVREKAEPENDWASLVRIQNKKELLLAGESIASAFTPMESGVQVYPSRINADPATLFWLPAYFAQWYGPSLVLPDERAAELDQSGALANPGEYSDTKIAATGQKGGLYEPLLPDDPELKYGKQYEFRVRLADMTGGGPLVDDPELNDAPAKSASIVFKRYVAPKQLKVVPGAAQPNPDSVTNVFYEGDEFKISRPRLGYPALLFTEMDTVEAFQRLVEDRDLLHTDKIEGFETIKDPREVSFFDPDVDQFMVVVEIKSLMLDNLESLNQREAFIPLYTTFRNFPNNPEESFALALEYRDANVIDFGNKINLGDLNLSQTDIDDVDEIVLPRSRDIRITLLPVCSEKEDKPEYFGFAETMIAGKFVRAGEPIQFYVRQDTTDETEFFNLDLESRQLQGIYLQPDPPKVNNPKTFVWALVAGKELDQSTLMQRLASQLGVDYRGLSLIGNPGERIQFGCSNRIRHTLAPDNSSLTFSTKADLFNHWLCVLSFEINRDWTWKGLSDSGIEISREKQFTDEDDTLETEVVGYLQLKDTASRIATTDPDRSFTRVVFIDAVEPKKDLEKPATQANPFPNTLHLNYTLTPTFIPSVTPDSAEQQIVSRDVDLPVTTKPRQVPKVVAAGYALSPYRRDEDYSETAVRQRYLWLEFEHPIEDPNDTYFARILTYAPDPLLTFPNPDQALVIQEDPPLGISPELIRVITHDQSDDNAGIDAMQMMMAETSEPDALVKLSPVHYLLPLPPGSHNESSELFGFFTYELRVGHSNQIWCTAQGRFGHPIRVNGVQHPAPPLKLLVDRTPKGITVTAQYATAVFDGKNVTSKPPKTEIWCMLYAQTRQADGKDNRNILLSEVKLEYVQPKTKPNKYKIVAVNLDAPATGVQGWTAAEIQTLLERFNLDKNTHLSVLAVEMMPRYEQYIFNGPTTDISIRPLSRELGQYRILRTSRLVAAPEIC